MSEEIMVCEKTVHIHKGANGYVGYVVGEKNACNMYYLDNDSVAYIHNMPIGEDAPIVEEKIFFAVESVNGQSCYDDSCYKGKKPTNCYGVPLKGKYLLTSWFVAENGDQFGDPVDIGLLELEVDDQSGKNYKKVIEYLASYAIFHDFWCIHEEHKEALAEFLKYKERNS
jgi:hypothetical protein